MQSEFDMAEIAPILSEVIESGGEFRLYPKGVSMRPLIVAGRDSVVLVRHEKLQKNGMYLYRRKNGQYVLHRLIGFEADGAPVFRGDNQTAKEYGIGEADIVADVNGLFHDNKPYSLTSFRYRAYLARLSFAPYRFLRFLPRKLKARLHRVKS